MEACNRWKILGCLWLGRKRKPITQYLPCFPNTLIFAPTPSCRKSRKKFFANLGSNPITSPLRIQRRPSREHFAVIGGIWVYFVWLITVQLNGAERLKDLFYAECCAKFGRLEANRGDFCVIQFLLRKVPLLLAFIDFVLLASIVVLLFYGG